MNNIIMTLRVQRPAVQFDIEVPADTPLWKFKTDVLESVSRYCNVTFVDNTFTICFDRLGVDVNHCIRSNAGTTIGDIGLLNGDYVSLIRAYGGNGDRSL